MNIYSKWNENFYKSIEEGIAYNKRKDTKKGKQHSKQPKKVAKKTKAYR